jgi:hypothetical protein
MGDDFACSFYLYLYDLDDAVEGQAWVAYVTERFPALQNQS